MGLLEAWGELIRITARFNLETIFTRAVKKGLMENLIWEDLIKEGFEPCFGGSVEQLCLIPYDLFSHAVEIIKVVGG